MIRFESVEDILNFAIEQEQESADFYNGLAEKVEKGSMKKVFQGFAAEEMGHKKKLENVKAGKKLESSAKQIMDLKIGDYLVDVRPAADIDYQDALILAMKKEKAAFRLYSDLAGQAEDDGVRDVLLELAQEEARHKLRFEIEYDERVLTEN
ncbi:MAG: ferritin family protein [Planctomycetota bacterium]|jgi:rubrerythrin